MSDVKLGMGLTARMKAAQDAIVLHVSNHGVFPSRRVLAAALGCNATRASILVVSLAERSAVTVNAGDGTLQGFGAGGITISIPQHIAAQLCAYCSVSGDSPEAVVADAITLHLDEQEVPVPE